jgi:Protein of unknown function (DUF1592)/Protein of unknown function (DUF1588)/Protein of unknown function (DUF1595)/Protein of unknown function (DUF1585)
MPGHTSLLTRTRTATGSRGKIAGILRAVVLGLPVVACMSGYAASEPPVVGGPPAVRLMDTEQYRNAIGYMFGTDLKNLPRFPPMRRTNGLMRLGASTALVPSGTLTIFESAARDISAQVVDEAHRDSLVPCKPKKATEPDAACARAFYTRVGHLLFRRPLTEQELGFYMDTANQAGEQFHDFYGGLAYGLAGMMIAPEFLFFIETTEPDPQHLADVRLDAASKALRLSLLLWNSPPDDQLLQAAETGELQSARGLNRQVDRMLHSERLQGGVRAFFDDMLLLDSFADVTKDPTLYPAYTLRAATDSREQVLRIITDQLLARNGDYRDLFTTRHIFLTQSLAAIYRIPVSAAGPLDWIPYDLPEGDPRAGILTQVGFLSVNAHPGRSSATRRGKALRENFMCQTVPPPPPNVDFSAVETPDPKIRTARERLAIHRTNPACAGCHKITDPIGLALENFDGAGQFRATEKGATIDASGSLNGMDFSDAPGLGQAVHNNPSITSCLVQRIYQYGVGRIADKNDKAVLGYFEERFASEQYRFVPLLRDLATSESFYRIRRAPAPASTLAAAVRPVQ